MRRLCTVVLIAAMEALSQAPSHTGPPSASVNSMLAYPLTTSGFDQYARASRDMSALIARKPDVLTKLKPSGTDAPNSIDQTVAFTKQHCPECVSTVERSMPYRDYVLFQGSLVIAYVSALRPRANSKVHVAPENIKFVLANRAKIDATLAEQRQHPAAAKQ